MFQRTDLEKRNKEPIKVNLGGKEYLIHPKPLSFSRKWKIKAVPVFEKYQTAFENLKKTTSNSETVQLETVYATLKEFLLETIDESIELVFEWEPELPKDEILDNVYDHMEFIPAIEAVIFLAFPLLRDLKLTLTPKAQQTKEANI